MEIPLISRTPHPPTTSFCSSSGGAGFCVLPATKKRNESKRCFGGFVRASAERSREGIDGGREGERGGGFTSPAMEVTTLNRSFNDTEFPVWEKIGAVVRLSYGIGIALFSFLIRNGIDYVRKSLLSKREFFCLLEWKHLVL